MPKTIRNCYNKHLTFSKLLEAHYRASKNHSNKKEILLFNIDLESNIINIMKELKNGSYKVGKYREFIIYEPKQRTIKALAYKDRIVQQWYIGESIKNYFIPRFINDSYACIDGKGTHKAVLKIQKYMQQMKREYSSYYILKCDIQKYFYSIKKNILYKILSSYISDKKLLSLTYLFVYSDSEEEGIPIGNYTSQFFANIYLHELDKYVKEELKIKYYVRYMDDFIVLLNSKEKCCEIKKKITNFLNNNLEIKLNKKSCYFPNEKGLDYCGYKIYETHKLLRKRSKEKIKKSIKKWNYLYNINKLDYNKMIMSFNSWKSHAKHADSYNFRQRIYSKLDFISNNFID